MEPGWVEPGLDGPMHGPKLPNVEESHKYGPGRQFNRHFGIDQFLGQFLGNCWAILKPFWATFGPFVNRVLYVLYKNPFGTNFVANLKVC